MSSSSLYEPEEDDEASDSDIETGNTQFTEPPSSPPSRRTRLSSPSQLDGKSSSKPAQISRNFSRVQMLERLKSSLSEESVEAYSNLLAQTANDFTSVESKVSGGNYQSTQTGIVSWSPKEKEIFFNLLDRKGKDGIRDIASAIGTKSELEVQEYLRLLHSGLEWQRADRQSRTIVLGDVPAADEVSNECCDVLDKYSELLVLKEQQDEDIAGRQRHQDLWIIDRDNAELVEELETQDQKSPANASVYHTSSLFNVPRWVRLSERLFMNFGGARLEDNWVNIAYAGEAPAITADALAEFNTLAVSVTRRLIQSALFFAMSRRRRMREGDSKAKVVKAQDVRTALDVLNMKRDGFDYWAGVARRCSLDVSDSRHRKGWKSVRLSHDEVEDMLFNRVPIDAESNRSTSRQRVESRIQGNTDGEYTDSDEDRASDNGSEFNPEHPLVASAPLSQDTPNDEEELLLDSENKHAEQEDQKASCLGELEIWKAMGRPAPNFLVPTKEEDHEDTTLPIGERTTKQEFADWREKTVYRSDWEEYGHEVYDIYEEISEKRRKRRRLDDSCDPSSLSIDGENNQTDGLEMEPTTSHEHLDSSEDDHENIKMDVSTAPDQNTIPQDEDGPSENPYPNPEINNTQHKQTTNPKSHQKQADESDLLSPESTKPGYRSPILTRRRRIQAEPEQGEESASSGSDDDLPAPREYPSSEQDDIDGMPLYSQPMSPADWPSE
ncbi:hypothetical protein BDV26DRAFT_274627 [Aspergillus bertholletiae]|uniref:Myb-like domain-containing protein n=1 Tax=Aspergillus bertholletiae TaxID=1226010 RepID=A0A5N7AS66_9EURO|nr:hypothetical protein BDV26DRAFT_274627 [Aspergillus bertholletiae]